MFLMLLLNEWTGLSLLCMSTLTSLNFPPSNCCGPLGLLLPAKLVFFCLYLRRYFGAHTNYQPLTMIFTWSSSHTHIMREHVSYIGQSELRVLGPIIDFHLGMLKSGKFPHREGGGSDARPFQIKSQQHYFSRYRSNLKVKFPESIFLLYIS